jgi:RNA polymerase sigma-70 factor (ECF subfamily)
LRRAAVNAALDVIRHRKTDRKVPLDLFQDNYFESDNPQPDRLYSESELRTWLRQALAKMNPRSAEIFALKHFEGYSNQEIAEILATSPSVIAVTLHRTRSRLQSEIQTFLGGRK